MNSRRPTHSHLVLALAGALLVVPLRADSASSLIRLPVIDRQDIRFTPLSTNGEIFTRWVLSIARDRQGFLWLGTTHGLYRYDGYSLKNYRANPADPNSLSDDTVRAIFSDRSGNLWIGTAGGGLDRLDPSRDAFIHYRHNPASSKSISGNLVTQIFQDSRGSLWLATNGGLDRFDSEKGEFVHYRHDPNDPATISSSGINHIYEDRLGDLWVGTSRGLNRLPRGSSRADRFLHDPADPQSLGHDYVGSIREDSSGVLWVAAGNLLEALDRDSGKFTHYSFHAATPGAQAVAGVTSILEDEEGFLWLSTANSGVIRFNRRRARFVRYLSDPFNLHRLRDNSVDTLFRDPEGLIWAGTKTGVSRFFARSPGFVRFQQQAANPDGLRDNVIWSLQEDSQGNLWIGTRRGVQRLDRRTGEYTLYKHDPADRHSLSYDTVSSIREDRSGNLWFGTYGGGVNRLDTQTGRFRAYRRKANGAGGLSSDRVLCLLFDRQKHLWVGTGDGGLNRLDPNSGRVRTYRNIPGDPNSLSDDNVKVLLEDRQGFLWIGTNQGLNRFDPTTERFTVYRNTPQPGSLSSDFVDSIHEDRQGTLWIGTRGGLNRMDRSRGKFQVIAERDGLPDDSVEAILEDSQGDLWLATRYGLSHFNPRDNRIRNYSETDGLAGNNMNPYGSQAACQTRNGEMVFGSSEGITLFRPERLALNRYVPPIVFTDFLLAGNAVKPGAGSPLARHIWALDTLRLNHRQNIFSIEFAALSYAAPEKNRYRYRLEGFEAHWNESNSRRRLATYTSLPAGSYVFRVQGSNNAGFWNEQGAALTITILPPWWATNWFRALTILGVAACLFAAYRLRIRSLKSTASMLELQVVERTRELQVAKDVAESANRAKSAFLAAMSHELRTPLNAILGFSNLLRERVVSQDQRRDLDIIKRSGEHLLGLINDVLDLAKIESGRSVLDISACDLKTIIDDVTEMIRVRAEAKQLSLQVHTPETLPVIRTDPERLRQILINLLGNAVRYTEQGSVTLRVSVANPGNTNDLLLTFEVEDTGIGIAEEHQARIFEPFVQAGSAGRRRGTGLGLTIAKQFVELMGGTIRVKSAPGVGSCFRVDIPAEPADPAEVLPSAEETERVVGLEPGQPEYRILIADDEKENWLLLQRLLQDAGFRVAVAANGLEAVQQFVQWRPHFIWMDLQMPEMDGIEATRQIRALGNGQRIPIAAVTASRFKSQISEVLAAGLDDVVLKPYRPSEIFGCIERHLGVRYLRKGGHRMMPVPPATRLRAQAFAGLPAEIVAELREALLTLNVSRISEAIGKVSDQDAQLGSVLAKYAEKYAYTAVLKAIDEGGGDSSQASA